MSLNLYNSDRTCSSGLFAHSTGLPPAAALSVHSPADTPFTQSAVNQPSQFPSYPLANSVAPMQSDPLCLLPEEPTATTSFPHSTFLPHNSSSVTDLHEQLLPESGRFSSNPNGSPIRSSQSLCRSVPHSNPQSQSRCSLGDEGRNANGNGRLNVENDRNVNPVVKRMLSS